MQPYKLPLGRNVLWAGTMNQDETTKSLSDKVIDRSIIINFPRPTELKRRLKLMPLDDSNRGPALHKTSWQSWVVQGSSFSEEEIKPFKEFIEKMNDALSVSGRALGHRVWQSIEYYMANYPDVRAAQRAKDKHLLAKAMHIAFEDQLVQKVMPKLRGIDTRGKSQTECLDKIRGQIVAGIGGNTGNQTITMIVRGLALHHVQLGNLKFLMFRELGVAIINGVVWGGIMGIVTWLLYGDWAMGGVMTLAMILNLLVAALMGVVIPMAMLKMGRDPAVGSSVLITALTDTGGFFIFLGLATLFLL